MNAVPSQLPEARKEKKDIQSLLQTPAMLDRFKAVVPQHLNPQRMLRVMALAIHKVPKLAECDPMTLLGAMMVCASLGIEPNTPLGHAYLIPFEKKKKQGGQWVTERVDVNLIIGYRGFVDLARRSGGMVSIHADVVYEGDEFSFEYGSNMHLRHIPRGARTGRKPIWSYAHAKLTDGEAFEVLPYDQVLEIRDNSQGYQQAVRVKESNKRAYDSSPWVAFEHEMAAKTMVRRLAKWLPLSIEFANAAALDAMSEANKVDYSAFSAGGDMLIDVEQARRVDEDPAQLASPSERPMTTIDDEQQGEKVSTKAGAKSQQRQAAPPPAEPPHDPETGEINNDAGDEPGPMFSE